MDEFYLNDFITAHAGSFNTTPNTLLSVKTALDKGAKFIEMDVRFNEKGEPVLSHNPVKKANNENLCKLYDALALLKDYDGVKYNLDIKETKNLKYIENLVKNLDLLGRVIFTGVSESFAPAVKKDCPSIPFYLNKKYFPFMKNADKFIDYLVFLTKKYGAVGLNVDKNLAGEKLIDAFHRENLLVSVWTVRSEDEAKKYIRMKADNVTCKIAAS